MEKCESHIVVASAGIYIYIFTCRLSRLEQIEVTFFNFGNCCNASLHCIQRYILYIYVRIIRFSQRLFFAALLEYIYYTEHT